MKRIQEDFNSVLLQNRKRCEFFGNIEVGKDVSIQELRDKYSAVILAVGAGGDREMGLTHESKTIAARRIINWLNSSLDSDLKVPGDLNLETLKDMIVIGNGNIFCDIARMLLKDPSAFAKTDMHTSVIQTLKTSNLQTIQCVARRGITHAALTLN